MNRKHSLGLTVGTMLFLIILAAGTFFSLNRYLTGRTEEEVQQIAEVFLQGVADAEYNRFSAIKKLRFAENDSIIAPLQAFKQPGAVAVAASIRRSATFDDLVTCALISESGNFAVVTGEKILSIDDEDPLPKHLAAGERYVTSGFTETQQVIIYASPLAAPMENGEESIGLLCMYPMDLFAEVMNLQGGHALVSFQVLRSDGSYVIRNEQSVGENIYDDLESYDTSPDTALGVKNKELEYALMHDESYMLHITQTDAVSAATERRSMYGAPMPESNLYLLTVMPYGVLGRTVEEMGRSRDQGTLLAVIIVSLGVLLVFLVRLYVTRKQIHALEAARILAEEASARAEEEAQDALAARQVAEEATARAEEEAQDALTARRVAEEATARAEEEAQDAMNARRTAENALQTAENARQTTEMIMLALKEAKDEAVRARVLAEEASARAEEEAQDAVAARQTAEDAMAALEAVKDEAVRARVEAESASHAKSEFMSNMSHDIRTPVNGIIGMTSIARSHMDDPERVADCLEKIDVSSKHLLSLINDVLDMNRIESGKVSENHAPFDMRALVGDCESIIHGQLANRNVRLVTDCEDIRHPRLIGDELHLRRIFLSILGNSVKFTKEGDSISFRARELACADGMATYRFDLEDTGIGMKPDFLPKLFDSFSQESGGSRTTYQGTGLGMAITKRLVDLLHGTIEVWSAPGAGTKFTIVMPFEVNSEPEEETAAPVAEAPDIGGMKILVAEDNAINMQIAVMILTESGATVLQAANGRLAVDAFAASAVGEIDAVLMDLMMPEMNGIEAAKAIRAMGRPDAASVPIIALTANAYQQDIDRVMEAGMNMHLAKPLEIDKLLGALTDFYIKGRPGQAPPDGNPPQM